MDIRNIKRRNEKNKKVVQITIRVTPELSKWLKDNEYSPTGIFNEAIRVLGFRDDDE